MIITLIMLLPLRSGYLSKVLQVPKIIQILKK